MTTKISLMPKWVLAAIVVMALLVGAGVTFYWGFYSGIRYRMPKPCEARLAARLANEERIKHEAHDGLRVGATRESVISFFAANRLSMNLVRVDGGEEAEGTIFTSGDYECHPVTGCGSDAGIFQVRVKLDEAGIVVSEAVFTGGYQDCL